MSTADARTTAWAERAADRSPTVERSRSRSIRQAQSLVAATRRLVAEGDGSFTTQQLVKEAGVALQTFYRCFKSKDELLLAVIGEMIAEFAETMDAQARSISSPLERLRFYITAALGTLLDNNAATGRRFITSEHYRLHQVFPDELAEATRPFTDLLVPEIVAAADAGVLAPTDAERDAWFVTQLTMATFHHYSFVTCSVPIHELGESLWAFCLMALGGRPGKDDSR